MPNARSLRNTLLAASTIAVTCWLLYRMQTTRMHTVGSRLTQFGDAARARLSPFFDQANAPWPGTHVTLVAFKDTKCLQVHSTDPTNGIRHIKTYPILGASGRIGPKLREGDLQVPEGIYKIESLNPNSRFHVALRINYPNPTNLQHAANEGRDRPGSDIMIHGGTASIGCLAIGDAAAEELFTLAADVGVDKITVLLCPTDLRTNLIPNSNPPWIGKIYGELENVLNKIPSS